MMTNCMKRLISPTFLLFMCTILLVSYSKKTARTARQNSSQATIFANSWKRPHFRSESTFGGPLFMQLSMLCPRWGGPRDRVGTLIRNKNLESTPPGIRFQFKVPHLSWASTKSTKSTKPSQSASYFWIII